MKSALYRLKAALDGMQGMQPREWPKSKLYKYGAAFLFLSYCAVLLFQCFMAFRYYCSLLPTSPHSFGALVTAAIQSIRGYFGPEPTDEQRLLAKLLYERFVTQSIMMIVGQVGYRFAGPLGWWIGNRRKKRAQ